MKIMVHDFVGHPFVFELSRGLARAGHEVRHLFFGDYPGPQGHGERLADDPPGYSIRRIAIDRPYATDRMATRLRGNLAYARRAAREIRDHRPDVVLSGNTPTEIQGALMRATRGCGGRFVFWMQDVYSLAVSSLLRGRWAGLGTAIGGAYRMLDRRQIRGSDALVLISDGFRPAVERLGAGATPVWTIPNWGTLDRIPRVPNDNEWSRAHGVHDRFVYLYSGTLGLKHDPDLLIRLARALEDDPSALVLVAAQGAGRAALDAHLAREPQPNLRVLDLQPISVFPDMLGAADVMVALLEADAGAFSVPSKILSYLCAGKPTLLSAPPDNGATHVIRDADAGTTVAAGDGDAFVRAALAMRADAGEARRQGDNARAYAERHFPIPAIVARFEEIFESLAPDAGRAAETAAVARPNLEEAHG